MYVFIMLYNEQTYCSKFNRYLFVVYVFYSQMATEAVFIHNHIPLSRQQRLYLRVHS